MNTSTKCGSINSMMNINILPGCINSIRTGTGQVNSMACFVTHTHIESAQMEDQSRYVSPLLTYPTLIPHFPSLHVVGASFTYSLLTTRFSQRPFYCGPGLPVRSSTSHGRTSAQALSNFRELIGPEPKSS